MLFYKSLVSFVTAIALASSVTASATPERRQYPNTDLQHGQLDVLRHQHSFHWSVGSYPIGPARASRPQLES